MSELLVEFYSEEIPSNLQSDVRKQINERLNDSLKKEKIIFKNIFVYSCPTRLTILIKDIKDKVKIPAREIRGPKVGVIDDVLNNFMRANNINKAQIFKKHTEKGDFYFFKKDSAIFDTKDLLIKELLNIISSLRWKKSMRWSTNDLHWGRPLRSIMAIYNGKILKFTYGHLSSKDFTIIEENSIEKSKKINSFEEYDKFLSDNNIALDQEKRKKRFLDKFEKICKSHSYKLNFKTSLIEEVNNLVDNPNVLHLSFHKKYLELPNEIIISTLESHQRYFPLFNEKNELTNNFFVVSNKVDKSNLIKDGNRRVVDARLSDARFFWDKDKSKNLIKQISNLKKVTFYDKLGTIFDKTQRLRKLCAWVSDEININKEKVEIAASICKSDLCSDLVNEYPDLQGVMGKYFALAQGFESDISNAISDHYLPIGNDSQLPKKPISYTVSIVDKLDTLIGFFMINEKPTGSKDPFALRRSAIGLLKTVIENKINLKLGDLISYNIKLYEEQKVINENKNTEVEILSFLRERVKNIFKDKKIKNDIIDASISSHSDGNFYELYKKNLIMNKYINKEIGKNVVSSYKRAFNIIEKEGDEFSGRPDAVLFRKKEENSLFEKLNEIRKSITVNEDNKDFEKLLVNLSETKMVTDSFFDNVVVNDENIDIKNNRLELLKMFCNTFNTFINFSKLEGIS